MRQLVFSALLLLLVGVFGFATLEVLARIFDPIGSSYYPSTAAFIDTMIKEEPIGYRNRPNLRGTYYQQTVTTNSLGLRHTEIALAPSTDTFRILMLGDSVVFGVGVSDEDTLPKQLENRFNDTQTLLDGRKVEVINMGCISYNSEQELIQYQQLGEHLAPDLIHLVFTPNDIEPKMWIFEKRSNWLLNVAQRSHAVALVVVTVRRVANLLQKPDRRKLIQTSSYREGHPRWQAIDRSLTELNRLATLRNIPFIVSFPNNNTTDKSWQLLDALATREGFPLQRISPFDDKRWSSIDPVSVIAKGGGGHLDADGLAMYTELIYSMFVDWHSRVSQ